MPKLLGGSPGQLMEPNKVVKAVKFYDGTEIALPRNWKAMLHGGYEGDEYFLTMKKFPQDFTAHAKGTVHTFKRKMNDEEVESRLKNVRDDLPTVSVMFDRNDDGYAYYNIAESISASSRGTMVLHINGVRGEDIQKATKCALETMQVQDRESHMALRPAKVKEKVDIAWKSCADTAGISRLKI